MAECSDHGHTGTEYFLLLPWGSGFVRVADVRPASFTFMSGQARGIQHQLMRGQAVAWRDEIGLDNLFGRTFYNV